MNIITKTIQPSDSKRKPVWPKVLLCVGILGGLISASRANAASFGVRVVDEFGKPVSGAAVCIGTRGKTNQFGSYLTSASGDVVVDDLPLVPLSVIVSKKEYQGVQLLQPIRNWNLVTQVTLLMHGAGPVCDHQIVETAPESRSLTIDSLYADRRGSSYTISSEVSGKPSHYRVSDRKDFQGARWLPYNDQVKYWGKSNGTLYFQVKRFSGSKSNWLEAKSTIVEVAVN